MKTQDLFEFELETDEDLDLGVFDFSDEEESDPADRVFFPSQLTISPTSYVDLITNSQIIKSGQWSEIHKYIADNWSELNGTYTISEGGMPLHTFRVARIG
jgi:hypothetical protein